MHLCANISIYISSYCSHQLRGGVALSFPDLVLARSHEIGELVRQHILSHNCCLGVCLYLSGYI